MNENKLELIRFEASSFMGIDSENPVVLDFSKLRKKKNITILEGNQGVGKSSTLTALLYALGAELDFKKENIVNLKDDTVSLEFEFASNDVKYRVRASKTKFSLELWNEDNKVWFGAGEPKATLKKLLGNVATSPMFLKEMDGKKQINWLRKTFSKEHEGAGRKPKEETLMAELAQQTAARTNANREYTRIKATVESSEYHTNREAAAQRFEKPVTIDAARAVLKEATTKKTQLDSSKNEMERLAQQDGSLLKEIEELENQLRVKKDHHASVINRKEAGQKWIKENEKLITQEFTAAQTKYENINVEAIAFNDYQRFLADEKMMHEFQDAVVTLDGKKDAIREELLKLTKKYLPKLKGLELAVATGIDDTKEGLFYNGKTMAQISESELWEIFLAICEHNEIQFVVIENITSLGSNAIQVLNDLAAKDVKIFASAQQRKLNELKITFTDKID